MRVDPRRLEAAFLGEAAQDQECAGTRQRPALGVEEQLVPVALVEVRPAAAQVAPERIGGAAAERHDPLLAALADRANEPFLQVDPIAFEADRLADPQARAVEQLDERAVAEVARTGS